MSDRLMHIYIKCKITLQTITADLIENEKIGHKTTDIVLMNNHLIILSGHDNPDTQIAALERGIIELCRDNRLSCLLIPHIYHIAESSKLWKKLADHLSNAIFLCWLQPRPARWLLKRHQIECDESQFLNLNSFSDIESAFEAIMNIVKSGPTANIDGKQGRGGKKSLPCNTKELTEVISPRWYPVIDGSRCINCQHCLQFCLFGVYELDANGKVQVLNPDQCKPGCPACARICPQSAIMFPLYEKDDAIAGAPGRFVTRDAAARKMFYARTKQTCPVCGRKAERKSSASVASKNLCPECGGPVPDEKKTKINDQTADHPPFDDLDKLVDQLDKAMHRRHN
jgi:NAD-dependent dihydropyrimidine dehydrogenase PreA subunit